MIDMERADMHRAARAKYPETDRRSATVRRWADNTTPRAARRYSRNGLSARARSARRPSPATMSCMLWVIWRRSSMPWMWSAWACVHTTPSSVPTPASISCGTMSGPVSTRTRVVPSGPWRSTSSEQRRRRFFGLAGSQSPQCPPSRGTPAGRAAAKDRGADHAAARVNSRSKLALVCAANSASDMPNSSAPTRAVWAT